MTIDIQLYAVYTDNRTWWWWSFVFRIIFLLLLSRVLSSVMLTKSSFDDYSTSVSFIFARLLALFMIQFPHDLCNFQTLRMSQQQRHHAGRDLLTLPDALARAHWSMYPTAAYQKLRSLCGSITVSKRTYKTQVRYVTC